MSFTWDINPATLAMLVLNIVVVVAFIIRASDGAAAARKDAAKAIALAEESRDALAEFRVEVAQTYASRATMAEALRPLLDEMHQLRDRIDKLIDRASHAPGPRPRS
jgi:undecaprenyl pyrophosphate synthase